MKKSFLFTLLCLFFSSENLFSQDKFKLRLTNGTNVNDTEVRYLSTATTGLDSGYDAGSFSGTTSTYDLSTQLVNGTSTTNFDLQVLPPQNYSAMIVPLVVKSPATTEVSIVLENYQLPENHNIYLEDREEFTFTLLSVPSGEYRYTPTSSSEIIGRFYIHVTEKDLVANGIIFKPVSGNWGTASNWSGNQIPLVTSIVSVPNGKTLTIDNTVTSVDSFHNDGITIVNAGKKLEVTNNFVNSNSVTISSDATSSASLLVKGVTVGAITYDRYITTNWHLVSSPVRGQDVDAFVAASNLVISTTNPDNLGLGTYNNTNSGWAYYNGAVNDNFVLATGYSIKSSVQGRKQFSGTLHLDAINDVVISDNSDSGNKWNLIGNPYPNYLSLAEFLSVNIASFDPSFVSVYLWNSKKENYELANNLPETQQFVAPGQAFFVNAKNGGATIKFTKAMQTHQSEDYFLRNNSSKISLKASVKGKEVATHFYFIPAATNGLDIGYDAGLFSANSTTVSLSSRLVESDNETKFGVQCLKNNFEDTIVIPVELKAAEGEEVEFSIEKINISQSIAVYLEDKITNTFTLLNAQNYTTNAKNEYGRFFLHLKNKALSISLNEAESVSVENNGNVLFVRGLVSKKVNVKLFDINGREVFKIQRLFGQTEKIKLPKMGSGIYILQLVDVDKKYTKKIVLR